MASEPLANAKPTKWIPRPGNPPKVTLEVVERVAERVAKGMSKKHALAIDSSGCTVDSLDRALAKHAPWQRAFDGKVAEFIERALDGIRGTTRSTLPVGDCWLLERAHGFYPNPKSSTTNVQVNIVGGVEVTIAERAAQLLRTRHSPLKDRLGMSAAVRASKQSLSEARKQLQQQQATVDVEVLPDASGSDADSGHTGRETR